MAKVKEDMLDFYVSKSRLSSRVCFLRKLHLGTNSDMLMLVTEGAADVEVRCCRDKLITQVFSVLT